MLDFILIFVGAGIGGVLRFFLASLVYALTGRNFPYGTLFVNLSGCFIIGLAYIIITHKLENLSPYLTGFIIVGILGGYTTFSSFSLETLQLIERGHFYAALINILVSVISGIGLTYLGIRLGTKLVGA
jgi:fluoride exporter